MASNNIGHKLLSEDALEPLEPYFINLKIESDDSKANDESKIYRDNDLRCQMLQRLERVKKSKDSIETSKAFLKNFKETLIDMRELNHDVDNSDTNPMKIGSLGWFIMLMGQLEHHRTLVERKINRMPDSQTYQVAKLVQTITENGKMRRMLEDAKSKIYL